jgi:hypothetical protein
MYMIKRIKTDQLDKLIKKLDTQLIVMRCWPEFATIKQSINDKEVKNVSNN